MKGTVLYVRLSVSAQLLLGLKGQDWLNLNDRKEDKFIIISKNISISIGVSRTNLSKCEYKKKKKRLINWIGLFQKIEDHKQLLSAYSHSDGSCLVIALHNYSVLKQIIPLI